MRIAAMPAIALALAALAMGGCLWHPARAYVLQSGPAGLILYPPPTAQNAPARTLQLTLNATAACRALSGASTGPSGLGMSWSLASRRLRIQLTPALARWGDNLPLPLISDLNALRTTLDQATQAGCLPAARAQALLVRAAQSVPLSPRAVQVFLYGGYAVAGYIDVRDPVRLQLTWALDRAQPERYDRGYASVTCALLPSTPDGRGGLREVAHAVYDVPSPHPAPMPPVQLNSAGPRFYRLFFLLRRSPADHNVGLLSAVSWPALLRATGRLQSDPAACAAMQGEAACRLLPLTTGLEARLRVWIQGRESSAALTDTVGDALQFAGVRSPRLTALRVERPYAGGWAPVHAARPADLLRLPLAGNDRITW